MTAKVQAATYNQTEDTVIFQCNDGGKEDYYLHWPRAEFGAAMQIRHDLIPVGGIPVNTLLWFLPTMVGRQFKHLRIYVSPEDDIASIDGETMTNEAYNFRESLGNGNFRSDLNKGYE